MYSRNSFGDFYPIESSMHKINPIIKLISFIICIVLFIGSNKLELHVFALALIFVMMLFSNVPMRFYFNTIYSLRFILLILLFLFAHLGFSFELCLVYFIKIIVLLEYLNIIIYTTSPSELYYGIEGLFAPFNILNFNMGGISLAIVNIIKFIPLLITTEYKILKTQASRGIDYHHTDIIGKIYAVVHTLGNTLRVCIYKLRNSSEVSKLRMFSIKRKRSNLRVNYAGFYDFIFLLFHVALLIGYVFERGLLNEVLAQL